MIPALDAPISSINPSDWPALPEILVADDEYSICFTLAAFLHQQGFTAHVVADGQSALDLLDRHRGRIRIAFLDVRMPWIDGRAVCRLVRSSCLPVQCCLMSAFHREIVQTISESAFCLPKPFDFDEFEVVLANMLNDDRLACQALLAACLK